MLQIWVYPSMSCLELVTDADGLSQFEVLIGGLSSLGKIFSIQHVLVRPNLNISMLIVGADDVLPPLGDQIGEGKES